MENKKIKVGIIGCGTIGMQLAQALENGFFKRAKLSALCDIDKKKAENLKARCAAHVAILSIEELIDYCDFIVEAAAATISYAITHQALQNGKDIMIMSVAGILEKADQLSSVAQAKGGHIYLPSGAIGGIDAVKAASVAKIDQASLVTRKPPQGLKDAPFIKEKGIDLSQIQEETVIFEGSASEAMKGFPKNVNVCATLSLAGIGAQKTKVKIITSPDYKANTHEVCVEGDFGKIVAKTENVPTPSNPKTSFLASLSAMATLKNILDVVKIGT